MKKLSPKQIEVLRMLQKESIGMTVWGTKVWSGPAKLRVTLIVLCDRGFASYGLVRQPSTYEYRITKSGRQYLAEMESTT